MISIPAFLSHIDGHDWYCLSKSPAIELRRSDEDALFFRRAVSITPVPRSLTIENFVSMLIERERKRLFDGSITGGKVENFADAAVVQINDSIWGHIWFLIRGIRGPDALAIVIYEIHGQVADEEVDRLTAALQRLPNQISWNQLVGDLGPVIPITAERILPAIRNALKAAVDAYGKSSIAGEILDQLDQSSNDTNGILNKFWLAALLHVVLGNVSLAGFLDEKTLDETVALFEGAILDSVRISDQAVTNYLVSLMGRVLVSHPRASSFLMYRSIRICRLLCARSAQSRLARWRESLTTLLIALARLSIVDDEQDQSGDLSFVLEQLNQRESDLKRVLVSLLRAPSLLTGKSLIRERLARSDVALHVMQGVQTTIDSAYQEATGTKTPRRGIFDHSYTEFAPDEQMDEDKWIDEALFMELYNMTNSLGLELQAQIYGIENYNEKKIGDRISAYIERNFPSEMRARLLFLRGFRASRRIWLPNLFQFATADVLAYDYEPSELLIEAAISKGLAVLFHCMAIGGLPDTLGMARVHTMLKPGPDTLWREIFAVEVGLHDPGLILVLPDISGGLAWEIGQLIENANLRRTVLIMMPGEYDRGASRAWSAFADVFRAHGVGIEKYSPAGGFLLLDDKGTTRSRHRFQSLFNGDLARALYEDVTGNRREVVMPI